VVTLGGVSIVGSFDGIGAQLEQSLLQVRICRSWKLTLALVTDVVHEKLLAVFAGLAGVVRIGHSPKLMNRTVVSCSLSNNSDFCLHKFIPQSSFNHALP